MSSSTLKPSQRHRSARRLPLAVLGAGLTIGLALPALPATADTQHNDAKASNASATQESAVGQENTFTLKRGGFSVTVAKDFPRVLSYGWGQATLGGNANALNEFSINGTVLKAKTTARKSGTKVTYTSTFPDSKDFTDLKITSELKVSKAGQLDFKVVSIKGASEANINQVAIPGWSLVSVGKGGTLSRTTTNTDTTKESDSHITLGKDTEADPKDVGSPYAFVSQGPLAAGVISNASPDVAQSSNDNSNSRLTTRVSGADDAVRASVSPGTFTWAPKGATDKRVARYALPTASVVVSRDANADGTADWQDAAIAQRDATKAPLGANRVPERVLQRIPFNIVSAATNPFLKTLDQTESLAANTDGLGQYVLLKGYGSEGHDSANTDYGGHTNERAGGLKDMNTLLNKGDKLNADFSVHVNTTEAYPQARSFSDRLVQGQGPGWNWMNQSFGIDQRHDLGAGGVLDRFASLKKDSPKLDGVYIDVYYSSGWLATALASQLHQQGLEVASEWAYKHEGDSLWSHWATDRSYGGETNKGLNSQMIRFMFNSQRDVWNPDPVLGGVDLQDFEGWQGKVDRNKYMTGTWETNLPTKYLQHFDLLSWKDKTSATFTDDVSVSMAGKDRVVTQGGVEVQRGNTYLLPWQGLKDSSKTGSPLKANKMYFHPGSTGSHTFELTKRFAGNRNFTLYRLTDNGRTDAVTVKAKDGKVTLNGESGQAYVLVPNGGAKGVTPSYGTGTGLSDPGFTSGSLNGFNHGGSVTVSKNSRGDGVARLGASKDAWKNWVGQSVKGLKPGKRYAFTSQVATPAGQQRLAALNVSGSHGQTVWEWKDVGPTTLKNQVGSDAKHSTYFQQARLDFVAPKNGKVDVSVLAGPGTGNVEVDDLRIIELKNLKADDVAPVSDEGTWDFEDNVPGYGPFLRGNTSSGIGDAQTSVSERHDPYTSKQWRNEHYPFVGGAHAGEATDDVLTGQHSLKLHEEADGTPVRTSASTVAFKPGHKYKVAYNYQASGKNNWSFQVGADRASGQDWKPTVINERKLPTTATTTKREETFTAGCGVTWVGFGKKGGGEGVDLVLDDVTFTDLGASSEGATCAQLEGSADDAAPGVTTELTTTLTNHEETPATRAHVALSGLPEGWSAKVAKKDGNVAASIAPGESLKTTWLLTAPESAKDNLEVGVSGVYSTGGQDRTLSNTVDVAVTNRAALPASGMKATADSQNGTSGSEGPASNAIDGNESTVWHTDYSQGTPDYPHWISLDLGTDATVSGLGYLGRQAGGNNGKIKDYVVEVSQDGKSWTQVAAGSFKDTKALQSVDFSETPARHIRLTGKNALNGLQFAAAAEIKVFGTGVMGDGFEPSPRG